MKCSSKKRLAFVLIICIALNCLSGCGISRSYERKEDLRVTPYSNLPIVRPKGLASENVVIPYDEYVFNDDEFEYEAGLLINDTANKVITAVNPHKKIYPASMTKILTAIVVMDAINSGQISLNDTVVVSKDIEFNEENVTVLGLQTGDYITVNELMHGLLIASYNDCAIVLARYVAGSVSNFVEKMNEKAALLGATNSHFVNPHGLHDNNHYTTPYDLYLIFKAFLSYPTLVSIDENSEYTLKMYRDSELYEHKIQATNGFMTDSSFEVPTGYHITGWKTGTTDIAGNCIIIEFVNDNTHENYICLVSNAENHESLYKNVEDLLKQVY